MDQKLHILTQKSEPLSPIYTPNIAFQTYYNQRRRKKIKKEHSQMGRQNGDATMVNSSIALLQERFRELQRTREKRQEKEILKLFSAESESRVAPTMQFDQPTTSTKLTSQPDQTILSHRPSLPQDSLLSLGLSSQSNKHPDFRAMKSTTGSSSSSSRNFENSSHDVDTSLHL